MGDPGLTLPRDLLEFFEGGVSILVGTRDAKLVPHCTRALGARVIACGETDDSRDSAGGCAPVVRIHIPQVTAARTIENLGDNRAIAVTFSRPLTHYSIQIKGECIRLEPSDEEGRATQLRYHAAYTEQLHAVGIPRSLVQRLVWWPSVAVDIQVRDFFVQTPGPTAGRRLVMRPDGSHDAGVER